MRILICEDDVMTMKALEYHLKKTGYDTMTVNNGRDAIQKLESINFDLVLCDIHMPVINGLQVINHVRSVMKSKVPVLMLTRIARQETIDEAYKLGANGYITKPFHPENLTLQIGQLLSENETVS